ncbi:hypothetical protein NicSoilB8_37140 [Arthrobacter sp. NicSoilB8]|nr:hypothetical protein NicSoilB8_37140 [Arthrobacter sp. NicSoilB8]
MLRMVQQMEGLDAAARAEVEGLGDMPAGGHLDQGGGGLSDPEDMVMAEDSGALVGREVAGHPEIRSAMTDAVLPHRRVPAVRPQVHFGLDQALALAQIRVLIRAQVRVCKLHEPEFQQPVRADAGEGGVEGLRALRLGQEPETHDGGERSRGRLTGGAPGDDQRGDELVPGERRMGSLAKQLRDAVHAVADGAQIRGQGLEEAGEVAPRSLPSVAGCEGRCGKLR